MTTRPRPRGADLRAPLYLSAVGAVSGGFVGLLEAVFVASTRETMLTAASAVNIAVLYALFWGCVGVVLGVVSWVTAAIRGGEPLPRRLFYGTLLFSLTLYGSIGGHVNVAVLPTMFSRASLVANAGMLFVTALIWFILYRIARTRVAFARRGARRLSPLGFSAAALVVVLLIAGIVGPGGGREAVLQAGGPESDVNILIVLVDAMRPDHLGCYGYDRNTSPNIDAIADEGVRFDSAYAQGSRTKETTASLVTSLYAATHNVSSLSVALPEASPTLPELMRAQGYRTAILTANPLISPSFGFGRGVDHFYCEVNPLVRSAVIPKIAGTMGRRFHALRWPSRFLTTLEKVLPMPIREYPFDGRDAEKLNAAFFDWIDQEPDAPFFAYVHYMEPHTPYAPRPPFDEMFDPGYPGPKVTDIPEGSWLLLPFVEGKELPEAERRNMVAQYDGSIAQFDFEFGRLLDGLRSRGLDGRTIVIVTADHGEEFFDHRGWGHGQSLYEELIRIPLVVWCPGIVEGGRAVGTTVRQIDIMPTVLGAAGSADMLEGLPIEGINLWPLIETGTEPGAELPVMAEVYAGGHFGRALKTGDTKLIYTRFGREESVMLFDLADDPGERTDLFRRRPELAASMLAELERRYGDASSKRLETSAGTMDEATEERLRALGYMK